MSQRVHILATVRNLQLLQSALLVFKTLRVGFPTAEIWVWGNNLPGEAIQEVRVACKEAGAIFLQIPAISHGRWIERLMVNEMGSFWICDTDIVFFDNVQNTGIPGEPAFAGSLEPEFFEEWTKTWHVERLHPSLMWIDPLRCKALINGWPGVHEFFGTALRNLVEWQFVPRLVGDWQWVPREREVLFYDTMAGMHQAFGGAAFEPWMEARFEHLHCGTYLDLIGPHLSVGLAEGHRMVWEKPELAKGIRKKQWEYYLGRSRQSD
jgi:hypothetical protein